jgi:hypothetical protein
MIDTDFVKRIRAPHDGSIQAIYPDDFTNLCVAIHRLNQQWWLNPDGTTKDRNVGEMIALQHSELSEALEAHRKNKVDDHLPQYHGVDVELVDCVIRVCDLLGARFLEQNKSAASAGSPGQILAAKCAFNAERADHKPEARALPDGKKY